jgi:hypothetical protein
MFDPGSGDCKAKVGLLVLKECGRVAVGSCAICGIPICTRHQVAAPQGAACPDCAARDEKMEPRGNVGRARRRSSYYSHYGYYPLFYGHHYNDHDRQAFDDRQAQAGPADPGDQADKDFMDDYDASES